VYAELDCMLGLCVIEESNSSWSSPVTLMRVARKVNFRTIKDAYPLPHIEGLLSRLTYYISAIDLIDAFWQIPLRNQRQRENRVYSARQATVSVYSHAVRLVQCRAANVPING